MVVGKRTRVLDLSNISAREYFLKSTSYCNFDLPDYFNFEVLLKQLSNVLESEGTNIFFWKSNEPPKLFPRLSYNVNYHILANKSGKYAWRPLQLINPVLYVVLVHKITECAYWDEIIERFKLFYSNPKILCSSCPIDSSHGYQDKAAQISEWWEKNEQNSIELALEFDYLLHTDIENCYGSIYTHSIAWSLHGKEEAQKKENRRNLKLVGNVIDNLIQDMSHGQTNGIPQGSSLMDFIAEMVLGYADYNLTEKIGNSIIDYKILRYRDDYRIFVNNSRDGEKILKYLTETLLDLGLKLNGAKTKTTNNIIRGSIKDDKLYWLEQKQFENTLQKHFLILHSFALKHPSSGALNKALIQLYNKIYKSKEDYKFEISNKPLILISIVVDIAFQNPRVYPICVALWGIFFYIH